MRGLLQPEDFDWLADQVGLRSGSPQRQALALACVEGLEVRDIARRLETTEELVEMYQAQARDTIADHEWPTSAVAAYRDLMQIMRGPRLSSPPTPLTGFDKYRPGDPSHAQIVSTRATVLTAEDLAFGEAAWRSVSIVEQAQRGKPERRRKRAKKERRGADPSS